MPPEMTSSMRLPASMGTPELEGRKSDRSPQAGLSAQAPEQPDQLPDPAAGEKEQKRAIDQRPGYDLGNDLKGGALASQGVIDAQNRGGHGRGGQARHQGLRQIGRHREADHAPQHRELDAVED